MFLRVDTIFLPVTDLDAAREFYAMKIGLPELMIEEDFIGFAVGDVTVAFTLEERASASVSVVVESLEAAVQELEERGIEVIFDSEIDAATFTDPYNNEWILVQED